MGGSDFYHLISGVMILVSGIAGITGVYFKLSNKIDLVNQDLNNHKQQHEALQERVRQHENKIDERLDDIQRTMGTMSDTLNFIKGKLDK